MVHTEDKYDREFFDKTVLELIYMEFQKIANEKAIQKKDLSQISLHFRIKNGMLKGAIEQMKARNMITCGKRDIILAR